MSHEDISHESDMKRELLLDAMFSSRAVGKLKGAEAVPLHIHDMPLVGRLWEISKGTTTKTDKSRNNTTRKQRLHLIKQHKYVNIDEVGDTLQERVETAGCSFIITGSELLFLRDAKVQSLVIEVRTYISTLKGVHT
jgi:hypothetical protein